MSDLANLYSLDNDNDGVDDGCDICLGTLIRGSVSAVELKPTGQTEFQFKAGDLNFHSSSYDWLVIAGANAKYKGVGTINGEGEYKFMLTATDGDLLGGGKADEFRIKIWDDNGLYYDNKANLGDDEYGGTELGGGNIKIHKAK